MTINHSIYLVVIQKFHMSDEIYYNIIYNNFKEIQPLSVIYNFTLSSINSNYF